MSNKRKKSRKPPKTRNFVAKAASMHRGGAHEKSKSGERRKQKNQLNKELSRLAQQGDFVLCA